MRGVRAVRHLDAPDPTYARQQEEEGHVSVTGEIAHEEQKPPQLRRDAETRLDALRAAVQAVYDQLDPDGGAHIGLRSVLREALAASEATEEADRV